MTGSNEHGGDKQNGDGQGGDGQGGGNAGAGKGSAAEPPALAVIEAFGGIRPMAKTLGLAVSTVQGWKERAAIPANRHDQIRAAARDNGIQLAAGLLRASAGEGAGAAPQTIEGTSEGQPDESKNAAGGRAAKSGGEPPQEAPRSSAATATAGARGAKAPHPAPSSWRGGRFVPGLVAGVVLVVAVAAATIYTRPYWAGLFGGGPGQAIGPAVADIEARLGALEDAMPADSSEKLSAMSERLATLESAVSQGAGSEGAGQDPETRAALESLGAEVARMSDRIAALEQDVAAARNAGGTPPEEIVDRLDAEAQRIDALLAQQSELAGRIAAAEQALSSMQAAREAVPGTREALLLLATLQLRDALQGSGTYAEALTMLKNLADGDGELSEIIAPLERRASAGLPTLRDLQTRFPDVARRIAAIELGNEGEGWTSGVLRRLSEAVNLRPVGPVEGDAPTAVAARAEVKLNDSDLAGALAELDSLEGAAAEAAAEWRADAEARLAAQRAVSRLGALVSQRFATVAGG